MLLAALTWKKIYIFYSRMFFTSMELPGPVVFGSYKTFITICSIKRNSGKKFFLIIEHEVLFYETPFLHPARTNYVCGANRKQSEEVSSSGESSLEFWD
jgi:hypothetical protein